MTELTIEVGDARITIASQSPPEFSSPILTESPKCAGYSALLGEAAPAEHAVGASDNRFTRVLANGLCLKADSERTDHVAVIDNTTGLMWSVESMGDPADEDDGTTQEHCIEQCRQLFLLGYTDWRLPTRAELAGLVDDTRHDPAIDTLAFPRVKPHRHWTSTPAAWSSSAAWGVYFGGGYVSYYRRYVDGFALAVRRSGQ